MAKERVRERMYGLVKKIRADRIGALRKPVAKAAPAGEEAPSEDELAALEALLGGEEQATEGG